jgi:hypothetical protein
MSDERLSDLEDAIPTTGWCERRRRVTELAIVALGRGTRDPLTGQPLASGRCLACTVAMGNEIQERRQKLLATSLRRDKAKMHPSDMFKIEAVDDNDAGLPRRGHPPPASRPLRAPPLPRGAPAGALARGYG